VSEPCLLEAKRLAAGARADFNRRISSHATTRPQAGLFLPPTAMSCFQLGRHAAMVCAAADDIARFWSDGEPLPTSNLAFSGKAPTRCVPRPP
jgi:hypothetical protein